MIHDNSIQTFLAVQEDLSSDEEKVFRIVKANPWGITLKQTAQLMGVDSNVISGRFTSLLKDNRIKVYALNKRQSLGRNGRLRTIVENIYIINYSLVSREAAFGSLLPVEAVVVPSSDPEADKASHIHHSSNEVGR